MRRKIVYGGLALTIALIVGLILFAQKPTKEAYEIDVPKGNYKDITVNDMRGQCMDVEKPSDIPSTFKKAAENERLQLYVEEETIAFMVVDKCNGYVWASYDVERDFDEDGYSNEVINFMKGGFSLVTYDKFTTNRRSVLDSMVEKTYTYHDNGFDVEIDFKAQQIKFEAQVSIQGGDLIVHIPRDRVEEYNPNLWKSGNDNISINEIIVYPFFGATKQQEKGYIVIPDGSGALVHLTEEPTHTGGYHAAVYGNDLGYENVRSESEKGLALKPIERITLPIYGVIHEADQAGLLVISESGDSYAKYNYNSRDLTTDYYQSYFSYVYRKEYAQFQSRVNKDQYIIGFQEKPNEFDVTQRYVFLKAEEANYVGLAKKYRAFLEKKDGFKKKDREEADQIPMKIDFINQEITTGTLGKESVTTTTYAQAKEIIQSLLEDGYENLDVSFKTFIQKKSGYHFDISKELGGEEGFQEVLDFFQAEDIPFSYFIDYVQSYYERTSYTASKVNRQVFEVYHPDKDLSNYVNNPKYYRSFIKEDIDRLQANEINSLALGGFDHSLFTHYDKGKLRSRVEGMAYVKQLLEDLQQANIATHVYTPDAYLYSLIDNYYHMPLQSSDMMFVDETIPLISLVLSGYRTMYSPYMNFSSDDATSILTLIEYGVYPSFVLTGESTYKLKRSASKDVYLSELDYFKERMDHYYMQVNEALASVSHAEMIAHERLDNGVVKVTYSNDVVIIINYTNDDYMYEDVLIQAKGFVIL